MKTLLGSSPKTSIVGFVEGAFVAIVPVFMTGGFELQKDWPFLVAGILRYVAGRLQKDSDGITSRQDIIVAKAATNGEIPPDEKPSN